MASYSTPVLSVAPTGTFDMSSTSLATPPPSHPPSPMRPHVELPLSPNSMVSPPPYTPKSDSIPSQSWVCDLEKGPTGPQPEPQPALNNPTTQAQTTAKLSPSATLLLLPKFIIPLTTLYTALSFPFGASSALLGTHILSWQWPAYVDILSWRFMFLTILCGCALVGCFFGVLTILAPRDETAEPVTEAQRFAILVGSGIFMGLFTFAVGALALQNAPLDIPSSMTPARALAANATGLVVMCGVAVTYHSMCSHLSRVRTTETAN